MFSVFDRIVYPYSIIVLINFMTVNNCSDLEDTIYLYIPSPDQTYLLEWLSDGGMSNDNALYTKNELGNFLNKKFEESHHMLSTSRDITKSSIHSRTSNLVGQF